MDASRPGSGGGIPRIPPPPSGPPPSRSIPSGAPPPGSIPSRESLEHHAGPAPGDATRYLCAAARLDRHFRNAVIAELVEQGHRVPAPTPGTDLVRVLHECLCARREEAWAGLAMLAVLGVGLGVNLMSTALALVTLLIMRLLGSGAGPLVLTGVGLVGGRGHTTLTGESQRRGLRPVLIGLAVLFLAWWLSQMGPDLRGASYGSGIGSAAQFSGVTYLIVLVLLWLIAAALSYRVRVVLGDPEGPLSPKGVEPSTQSPSLIPVYESLRRQQAGPELLYSDHAPLVGLGLPRTPWQVNLELVPSAERRAEGRNPDPIDAALLHQAIAASVRSLGDGDDYFWDALKRITVTDRVFRPGMRLGPSQGWLGGMSVPHPVTGIPMISRPWVDALDLAGHERLRHYLAIRIGSWQEEVVVTALVRVTTQGGMLHLELVPYVLPPVAEAYHLVDGLGEADVRSDGAAALGLAARRLGGEVVGAISQVGTAWFSIRRAAEIRRRYQRLTREGHAVDHGPRVSVRELGSARRYQNVFQDQDVDRFFGTVSTRVFSAVAAELAARGYDTSAFENQAQNITNNINYGVQVSNSRVDGSVAGGQGSRTRVSTPPSQLGSSGG